MSLFVPSLPQPPPHFHNVGVYAHNEATRATTGQYAVQLQQEVFDSYLRSQGITRGTVIFKGPVSRSGGLDWESLGKHLDDSVTAGSSPTSSDFSSPSTPTVAFSPHHEREESASSLEPGNLPTCECLICAETVSPLTSFKAPCGHYYCTSCLENFVNASLKDDNIFPPQCCRKPLPLGLLSPNDTPLSWPSLSSSVCLNLNANIKLVHSLSEKTRERSVPIKDRIYCPVPQCAVFLGSLTTLRTYHDDSSLCTCHSCGMIICLRCTQIYHRGKTCTYFSSSASAAASAALAENQLKNLAKEKKWQTCPGCSALVERSMGCPHMACRCGTQFCYGCGVDWKEGCRCTMEELGVPLPVFNGGLMARQRRVRQRAMRAAATRTNPMPGTGMGPGPGPVSRRRRTLAVMSVENHF